MMKRFVIIFVLLVLLGFSWVWTYRMIADTHDLSSRYAQTTRAFDLLLEENDQLERDLQYYLIPENQEKSIRERFNYKKPGEEMIIIVPNGNSSSVLE